MWVCVIDRASQSGGNCINRENLVSGTPQGLK